MAKKLPAMQFYPGDWMKDPSLRMCSPAARGVWMDMLCLMFECEERGKLKTNGRPWTVQQIANTIAGSVDIVLPAIQELVDCGVAKQDEDGTIYSKRLLADEEVRQAKSRAGKASAASTNPRSRAGNGDWSTERQQNVNRNAKPVDVVLGPQEATQGSTKIGSSSSSSSSSSDKKDKDVAAPLAFPSDQFQSVWSMWVKYRKERKKALTPTTIEAQTKRLRAMGEARAVAMIEYTVSQGWIGLREEETASTGHSGEPDAKQANAAWTPPPELAHLGESA